MTDLIHHWERESSRRTRCKDCDLIAKSKTSNVDRRPYTEWSWQGNVWDSRTAAIPSCPPKSA